MKSELFEGPPAHADVAVEPPNAPPSPGQFDNYTENYSTGMPEQQPPNWLVEEAAIFAAARKNITCK